MYQPWVSFTDSKIVVYLFLVYTTQSICFSRMFNFRRSMKYNEQLPGCLLDIIIKVWVVAVGRLATQTNCSGGHRCYLASALQGAVQLTQLVRLNYPLTPACGNGYSVFQRNCTMPQLVRLNYPLIPTCGNGYSVFQRNCTTQSTCKTILLVAN